MNVERRETGSLSVGQVPGAWDGVFKVESSRTQSARV